MSDYAKVTDAPEWTPERWWAFAARASLELAETLDYDATAERIVRLGVPDMASWCVLRIPEMDGVIVKVAHRDRARQALAAAAAAESGAVEPDGEYGPLEVIQTGKPVVWSVVPDALLPALAQKPEHLQLLRTLGCRSYVIVPLEAGGRQLGTLTFVSGSASRRYRQEDLQRAQDLASRCAHALENARRHRLALDAVRARDELLASAAHDLRTPLTSIKAYAQVLRLRALRSRGAPATAERSTFVERLDRIDDAATRMVRVIDDLTDVARLQLGMPLVLSRQWVELQQIVRRVAHEHERATGRTVRITGRRRPISGWWDAARLECVLDNLIGNAIKFSPDGEDVTVDVSLADAPDCQEAVVAVKDRGVGVPQEDLPRLFNQFHRGSNVAGRIAGTGVGLAVADQIVKLHGGRITVESRLGEGTTLTVRLPTAAKAELAAA